MTQPKPSNTQASANTRPSHRKTTGHRTRPLTPADYLKKILTARVYDVAQESALDPAPVLSKKIKNQVLLKREDQQPVFSFKLRGAYNKMAQLTPAQLHKGVVCEIGRAHV